MNVLKGQFYNSYWGPIGCIASFLATGRQLGFFVLGLPGAKNDLIVA